MRGIPASELPGQAAASAASARQHNPFLCPWLRPSPPQVPFPELSPVNLKQIYLRVYFQITLPMTVPNTVLGLRKMPAEWINVTHIPASATNDLCTSSPAFSFHMEATALPHCP